MADALHPMLLDAKKEYLTRLSEILVPFVLSYLNSTYAAAEEEAGSRHAIICFQDKLRKVPTWNSVEIQQQTQAIENKYGFLQDLVAAVFVSYVKIMSSIRLSTTRPNVKLRLPKNADFIHRVFCHSARKFYENPHCISEPASSKSVLISAAIESAVREMLPLGDVLQAYLSSAVDEDHNVNAILSPAASDQEEDDTIDEVVAEDSSSSSSSSDHDNEERIVQFPQQQQYQEQQGGGGGMMTDWQHHAQPPPPPPPPPTPSVPPPSGPETLPFPPPAPFPPQQPQQQQRPAFFTDAADGHKGF